MTRTHNVPGGTSALKPPERPPLAPAPERSGTTAAAPAAADPLVEAPASAPAGPVDGGALPPPPPAVQRHSREQLNTKIRVDLRQRLNLFVDRHSSTVQGVLEAALDEYMARREWSWDDYYRAARRR